MKRIAVMLALTLAVGKPATRWLVAQVLFLLVGFWAGTALAAPFAYIPDGSHTVSVIDTATNAVVATVPLGTSGSSTKGVAVNPAGTRVYVVNDGFANTDTTVSVIDTSTNRVVATVPVGTSPSPQLSCVIPFGVAVNPAGTRVYVNCSTRVSVIDTSTNTVVAVVPAVPGNLPGGAAVNPAGTRAYVTIQDFFATAVIDTSTNRVVATAGVGLQGTTPLGVAVNPAGTRVYVTNAGSNNVSVIDAATNAVVATVPVRLAPAGVAVDPAGNRVYVANSGDDTISVINTATNAVIARVDLPTFSGPVGVALNPPGTRVYVANAGNGTVSVIDTANNTIVATVVGVPVGRSTLGIFITPGSGPAPVLTAAVLPSGRSVQVGTPASAFATIINASPVTATGCGLSRVTAVPATFVYQTTNPSTNAITGTPNTPANIPGNGAQTYVFSFTPSGSFAPTDVQLSFSCTNTNPALMISGVNTLLLSASATPVPDIVALAATLNNDGVVNIPGATGTGVFSVATVNVGSSGTITATADTGSTSVSLSLALCQTNPTTGACLASPASSVPTQINANATPTFGIFVTGRGQVPFDPAKNRIIVRFTDASGVVRGATSVAVRTQ